MGHSKGWVFYSRYIRKQLDGFMWAHNQLDEVLTRLGSTECTIDTKRSNVEAERLGSCCFYSSLK